jgi:putative IMPACT (imprinted ancient) family translation regulator
LAAKEATEVRAKVDAVVNAAPGDLGKIFLALDEFAAEKIDEEYSDDGSVHIQIECEEEVAETLKERLANATSGRAEFKFWSTPKTSSA